MRSRMLVAAGLLAAAVASPALAEDGYRHGRVRFVDPGVTVQRATEVSAEEAIANLPFLPGDRVWTDSAGRAEFQFPDGTVARLDCRSKLDYTAHEEGESERIVLRLWSGSLLVRVRTRGVARFEVETPAGMVRGLDRGMVRVDVEAGETRVSVYAGEAVLDDGRQQIRLAAGERTFARWGAAAEEPRRFDPGEQDEFSAWDNQRESEDRGASRSSEYLPDELDVYAGEFERNGQWQYEASAGYVWIPRVEFGWQPYSNGNWTWTPYGWTWVPYERWGWAPFHYGRWDYSASFGWFWAPGRTWGPGWVSWAVGGGYVGWCPLGRHDRPVAAWGRYGGHGAPMGRHGSPDAWSVVRNGDLGRRDVARRRVGVGQVDPAAVRVGESPVFRPTRDGRSLREGEAHPVAISRRQSPGDFVRELGVDNKTTIPAPWTRGYGPPPAGVDGARYGARSRKDSQNPPDATAANPSMGQAGTAGTRRQQRSAPWYTPPAQAQGSGQGGSEATEQTRRPAAASPWAIVRGERARRDGGTTGGGGGESSSGYRSRGDNGDGSQGGYRPRGDNGSSSGSGYRPRRESGGASESGYRPRGGGGESSGGGARPRNEGGASRPPRNEGGGGASSSGGGSHARPRHNN